MNKHTKLNIRNKFKDIKTWLNITKNGLIIKALVDAILIVSMIIGVIVVLRLNNVY